MPSMECEQEFEVLESIYKEIEIIAETSDGGSLVSMLLYPKCAGDTESRYVTLKLELHLSPTYPTTLPRIEIRNPRGLSEEQLLELETNLSKMRSELEGSAMLFQLIDLVQDFLTSNNRPSAECPICLMTFTDYDVFYTPACFHHYHSHCLGLHLQTLLNGKKGNSDGQMPSSPVEILCPVCRVELDPEIDIEKLLASPPAAEEDVQTSLTSAPIPIPHVDRSKLDALFQKQKEQGGIIDVNEDCIRLLRISDHGESTDQQQGDVQGQRGDATDTNGHTLSSTQIQTERSHVVRHSLPRTGRGSGQGHGQHNPRFRVGHGRGHHHFHHHHENRSYRPGGSSVGGFRGSRSGGGDFAHGYNHHRTALRQEMPHFHASSCPSGGHQVHSPLPKNSATDGEGRTNAGTMGHPTSRRRHPQHIQK